MTPSKSSATLCQKKGKSRRRLDLVGERLFFGAGGAGELLRPIPIGFRRASENNKARNLLVDSDDSAPASPSTPRSRTKRSVFGFSSPRSTPSPRSSHGGAKRPRYASPRVASPRVPAPNPRLLWAPHRAGPNYVNEIEEGPDVDEAIALILLSTELSVAQPAENFAPAPASQVVIEEVQDEQAQVDNHEPEVEAEQPEFEVEVEEEEETDSLIRNLFPEIDQ